MEPALAPMAIFLITAAAQPVILSVASVQLLAIQYVLLVQLAII